MPAEIVARSANSASRKDPGYHLNLLL